MKAEFVINFIFGLICGSLLYYLMQGIKLCWRKQPVKLKVDYEVVRTLREQIEVVKAEYNRLMFAPEEDLRKACEILNEFKHASATYAVMQSFIVRQEENWSARRRTLAQLLKSDPGPGTWQMAMQFNKERIALEDELDSLNNKLVKAMFPGLMQIRDKFQKLMDEELQAKK
jgi:hypothetical protein